MIITHETTIEQYEAWLATNPDVSSFKAAAKKTFIMIYQTLNTIKQVIRRKQACTSGKLINRTVIPFAYNKNAAHRLAGFTEWRESIKAERYRTAAYVRVLSHVENDDRNMEELKHEAIAIINNAY